jgi:hypothetical protein
MKKRAAKPSARALDAPLYFRTPVTPEEAFQAIGRLRREARDEIDRLIRFLDDTDGHMELEQDDGESGIADMDGLDEQVPFRDWMRVGMV